VPYGVRWFGLRAAQRRHGLLSVMWTAIGLDWKRPAASIASRLLTGAAPGAILCLHDGRGTAVRPDISNTIEAVSSLVPALADRGYRFETLTEILWPTQ
jgi:peptidoglycan/xylan/chitin deacetylase (PgdA/CDA1 family)